jgi:hypothetical protein
MTRCLHPHALELSFCYVGGTCILGHRLTTARINAEPRDGLTNVIVAIPVSRVCKFWGLASRRDGQLPQVDRQSTAIIAVSGSY